MLSLTENRYGYSRKQVMLNARNMFIAPIEFFPSIR